MSLIKSLSAAAVIGVAASTASAAISASWRVNPITNFGSVAGGGLIPNNAVSLSLLVNLTGSSLYNVSGLYLPPDLFGPGNEFTVYQNAFGGNTDKPNPALIPAFPALEFDSYVGTTLPSGNPAAVPGTYSGATGAAVFGPGTFDVAWGATPNTGPAAGTGLEIARVTLSLNNGASFGAGSTPVSGEVRDSLNPNDAIAVPPLPIVIPEPATLGLAAIGLGLVSLRRR